MNRVGGIQRIAKVQRIFIKSLLGETNLVTTEHAQNTRNGKPVRKENVG